MAKRPLNPHSQYGRKKIIQNARKFNQSLSDKELKESKNIAYILVAAVLIALALLLFLIGGTDLVKFWLTPKGLR